MLKIGKKYKNIGLEKISVVHFIDFLSLFVIKIEEFYKNQPTVHMLTLRGTNLTNTKLQKFHIITRIHIKSQ